MMRSWSMFAGMHATSPVARAAVVAGAVGGTAGGGEAGAEAGGAVVVEGGVPAETAGVGRPD